MRRLLICALVFLGTISLASARSRSRINLCSTSTCKKAASYYKSCIDPSVNPCENFYNFACGNWIRNNPLPSWKSHQSTTDWLDDQIREVILSAFEKSPDKGAVANSVKLGQYVYQKCMQMNKQPDSLGLAQLKALIRSTLGHDWTIGQRTTPNSKYSWTTDYARLVTSGVYSIFKLEVKPDLKNVTENSIVLDPTPFALGDKELSNLTSAPDEVNAYKRLIRKSAQLFCGGQCVDGLLEQDIQTILELESNLAKIKLPLEINRLPEVIYNRLTLQELSTKTKFDFTNSVFGQILKLLGYTKPINPQQVIIVHDVNYTVNAIKLLGQVNERTLSNYFAWQLVRTYLPYSTARMQQINFEFNQVTQGLKKLPTSNITCFTIAMERLPFALSRVFVDRAFTHAEKRAAIEMINQLQSAFKTLIEQNSWLDKKTKQESIRKLFSIRKNVAFPEWLLDNTELDRFYGLQSAQATAQLLSYTNYFQSLTHFAKLQLNSTLISFPKPNLNFDKKWPLQPAVINAEYDETQNSITIPAAFLKFPIFDTAQPFALNYGGMGAVIGHELTHAFDDVGRKYDSAGNLYNWWTAEAVDKFNQQAKCFIDQYTKQVDPITSLNLNGNNTLGENLADSGGLSQAYLAFKKLHAIRPSAALADLSQYTPEQLFFIAYANSWCTTTTTQNLRSVILYDVHAPEMYRVNLVAANSPDFGKAFNCPVGSKMNLKDKCYVW